MVARGWAGLVGLAHACSGRVPHAPEGCRRGGCVPGWCRFHCLPLLSAYPGISLLKPSALLPFFFRGVVSADFFARRPEKLFAMFFAEVVGGPLGCPAPALGVVGWPGWVRAGVCPGDVAFFSGWGEGGVVRPGVAGVHLPPRGGCRGVLGSSPAGSVGLVAARCLHAAWAWRRNLGVGAGRLWWPLLVPPSGFGICAGQSAGHRRP